jgi:hypothetical protein
MNSQTRIATAFVTTVLQTVSHTNMFLRIKHQMPGFNGSLFTPIKATTKGTVGRPPSCCFRLNEKLPEEG